MGIPDYQLEAGEKLLVPQWQVVEFVNQADAWDTTTMRTEKSLFVLDFFGSDQEPSKEAVWTCSGSSTIIVRRNMRQGLRLHAAAQMCDCGQLNSRLFSRANEVQLLPETEGVSAIIDGSSTLPVEKVSREKNLRPKTIAARACLRINVI